MGPRRRRLLIAAASVVACVETFLVVASFLLVPTPSTGVQVLEFRPYNYETVSLFGSASWSNYTFDGVTFEFHLWCATTPAAGFLCGNATEPGGARYPYSFTDGPPSLGPAPWQTWIAPSGHEAVQYRTGGTARLLVVV